MWLFIGTTLLVILGMLLAHTSATIDSISSNWEEYRCHPLYAPFVGFIKDDITASANFTYCMNQMGNELLKAPMDSLNSLFAITGASLQEVTGSLTSFRGVFGRLRKFMFSFGISTLSKATTSTATFIHYLIKIRDIFQRFVGQGYIAAFLAQVSVSFIESFAVLFISILKTFIFIMLAISFVLALFQPQLLAIVLVLASIVAASGA